MLNFFIVNMAGDVTSQSTLLILFTQLMMIR